jgi:hypothetical protein
MPETPAKLSLIMQRDHTGELRLWACRGEGKGCGRNKFRKQSVHCDDCLGPLPPDMTLEEVHQRLARTDA